MSLSRWRGWIVVCASVCLAALAGCGSGGPGAWSPEELRLIRSLSPVPPPPPSPGNRVADSPEAAALGAQLFADPGFSVDGKTSCATCHRPDLHFTDGQRVADLGRGAGTRNVPTVLGAAWGTWFFWDGRADSAWAQATGPIRNPAEHAFDAARAKARVEERYRAPMEALFGPLVNDPDQAPDQALAQIGKAIEAFERTLPPPANRLDAYVAALSDPARPGGGHLTPEEERGLSLFIGEANCVQCHNGPLLSDRSFHTLGLPPTDAPVDPGRARGASEVLADPFNCRGRWSDAPPDGCPELRYLDPSFPDWPAAFKTPGLRGVRHTAPYMHDGSMASLTEVLVFYNQLPGKALIGHRELTLQPLRLSTADLQALEAFLLAL